MKDGISKSTIEIREMKMRMLQRYAKLSYYPGEEAWEIGVFKYVI